MDAFFLLKNWLHYRIFSHHDAGHGVHSPFVYRFIVDVLEDHRSFYAYQQIEQQRALLLGAKQAIRVADLGAGGHHGQQRRIADIVRRSAIRPKFGQLLFRLANHYRPQRVLELGTSLGLGTAYLAAGRTSAQVFSIEGCAQTAQWAQHVLAQLGLHNVHLFVGPFEEHLPVLLSQNAPFGLVYIDGNHTYEATLRYFEQLLPHCTADTILVFDDINWSVGMARAWQYIQQHPRVVLTIDLFFVGMVFFRAGMAKQNFRVWF